MMTCIRDTTVTSRVIAVTTTINRVIKEQQSHHNQQQSDQGHRSHPPFPSHHYSILLPLAQIQHYRWSHGPLRLPLTMMKDRLTPHQRQRHRIQASNRSVPAPATPSLLSCS
ncbi:hypothetical protein AAFF_G00352410 [Aldrovandia affinis]|uniref:Uncharacterized protein n=1 Tax=Aldrovandia affinis TaxID=143900 RepID=A0AAD7WPE0_9TELE|nr:hypothetical protein AAFF_G00352410 [Aldrovandia affinis]